MRNVVKEYDDGLLTWEEAYFIATNEAAYHIDEKEVLSWFDQVNSLAIRLADNRMKELGYVLDGHLIFHKP